MDVSLKALIGKLNPTCRRTLEAAAGLCQSRTHYNVEIEHWLSKFNEDLGNDIARIFHQFDIVPERLGNDLSRALDRQKSGNGRMPTFSMSLLDAIRDAWVLASLEYNLGQIRSGVLLVTLLAEPRSAQVLRDASREFDKIVLDDLRKNLLTIVGPSKESAETATAGAGGPPAPGGVKAAGGQTPSLDQYTVDLTARAKAGKIDPVLGRDREIRQMIDILMRRRQNNPILTGEAGVGKTAVVEGFAMRVAAKDVPPPLQNAAVRSLDLGLLQAGAGVKGEFENRLKGVIQEVNSSPIPIILFIDEAHTLIGAGGAQGGGGDAANLLKPALARGELRTIAATTWAEYKKYFEKDAALTRRFQVVKVEEPAEPVAVSMMRGFSEKLVEHYNVPVLEEAIAASVHLSARYLTGRQLPDKSVSLLDTACSRVAISQTATPPAVEDATRRLQVLETEKRVLLHETAAGANHAERLAEIDQHLADTRKTKAELETRWKKELELATAIKERRAKLKPPAGKDAPPAAADTAAALAELKELETQLKQSQGEAPLVQPFVDHQTVAEVISAWTGVPVGRMLADEIQTVLKLKDHLGERVVGQNHALEAIARRIHTSRARLDDPQKPIGVFLLVGPSGVGKTETAIALADALYGGERNMVVINMSEYQEAHTVSSLKGSPPGYVGYGEGGVLTEAVRRKPYSVVLLDEVEKAHPDVMELFFQVFDKGVLEDSEGREIDFKNTIILLTSNVATDKIVKMCADPDTTPDSEALALAIRPDLEKVFPPALLGRTVVTPYYPIADHIMKRIVHLKLDKIARRVRENHKIPMVYDEALVDAVASRCKEVSSGARNVDNILTNTLLPDAAREFLSRMAAGEEMRELRVGLGPDGGFIYTFS